MRRMSSLSRGFSLVLGTVMLGLGCGGAGEDASTGGKGGTAGAGVTGGTAGTGTGGAGGTAGSGGANGGSGGAGAGAGGSGGSGAGRAGTGGTMGGSAGATGGSPGGAGAGGSAGGGAVPGECGAIATFEDGVAPTREVFVDAAAAGPGDGSEADPYPTLDAALGGATAGTAIRIRPGTYDGGAFASGLEGTAEAPIWIGGVPGEERPVISGGGNAFQLSGVSFVVVHDLEVTGQTANGINVDDGETASGNTHDLVFRDLLVHDIGDGGNQDCLKLSGVDRFHVLDSEFVGCSGGSAVDHVGCHQGLVARNLFRDLGGNGVQSKGGSEDIEITRNRFLSAGERAVNMGGSTGPEFFRPALSTSGTNFEARDIRVTANLFVGGVSPIAFVGCVDCLAANNTLIDPERWVVRILQETTSTGEYTFLPASNGRFVNNLVYYSLGALSTHVNVGGDTSPETFTFSNNLWYAEDAPEDSAPGSLPVEESAGVYGEDPGFAGTDDRHVDSSSPASGAGTALENVDADLDGDCYASPPSIGAYEAD
jgi:hypothetical protein